MDLISFKSWLKHHPPCEDCEDIPDVKLLITLSPIEHFLTPYAKRSSKCIKDLNERPEIIKILEENIGQALFDIYNSIFFCLFPKAKEIKQK